MKTIKPIIVLIFALGCGSISAQRFGETEQDSLECIKNLSLCQEFFKQRDYINAYEPWLVVYTTCPANHVNNFVRGTVILKTKIAHEKNPENQQKLINLLLETYDTRSKYFGGEGFNKSRKAIDMMTYQPKNIQEAYNLIKEAMKIGVGNDHIAPFYYFVYAMTNEKAKNIDKEEVFEVYDIASSYLEKLLKAQPGDTQIINTLANLDIAFEPYAACEDIIPIYEKKYDENKTNIEFLEKVTKVLDHKDCNDSELFFKATEALHTLRPDPKTAYLMGKMLDGKKEYVDVIKYLKDDVAKLDNERDQMRAYLLLAKAYMNVQRYREGRAAAQKVLDLNPNEGLAYIFIAMLYAQSAKDCGDEPQVSQRVAYWAAVDKLKKAKEVDPNRAAQIDDLIAMYTRQFPSGDDLFYHTITEGSTYRVGCWIQESTIVRKRP